MKSVDTIVKKFTKAVSDLEATASALRVRAGKGMAQAERLELVAQDDTVEAERAVRIASRLKALVGE